MLFVVCVDDYIFYASVQSFVSERALDLYNMGLGFLFLKHLIFLTVPTKWQQCCKVTREH